MALAEHRLSSGDYAVYSTAPAANERKIIGFGLMMEVFIKDTLTPAANERKIIGFGQWEYGRQWLLHNPAANERKIIGFGMLKG